MLGTVISAVIATLGIILCYEVVKAVFLHYRKDKQPRPKHLTFEEARTYTQSAKEARVSYERDNEDESEDEIEEDAFPIWEEQDA